LKITDLKRMLYVHADNNNNFDVYVYQPIEDDRYGVYHDVVKAYIDDEGDLILELPEIEDHRYDGYKL